MTPQTPLQVATGAMRSDAAIWKETAAVLDRASTAASNLTLGKDQFSFVSDEAGLIEAYEKIRSVVQRLTAEGSGRIGELSQTLYKVADAYDQSDATASNLYGGVWDPKR